MALGAAMLPVAAVDASVDYATRQHGDRARKELSFL